jgi:WbqC-like protein family
MHWMKVAIAQPTYLPWLGYFDLIDQVDIFVILDSVQFEKQSWQQRNRIKTPTGLQWLTVPVLFRGRFGQLIHEVKIRDCKFYKDHLRAIELNYRRSPFFQEYFSELGVLLACSEGETLRDLNVRLLSWFIRVLGIDAHIVRSSAMPVSGRRTQLLAEICDHLGGAQYISPIGSAGYLLPEIEIMRRSSIEVLFQNFEHPEYRQLFPPFLPFASALDLIFNEGPRALNVIRSGRRTALLPSQIPDWPAVVSQNVDHSSTTTFQSYANQSPARG